MGGGGGAWRRWLALLKKNISDISNLHLKLKNINIDINNSWLNPNKERLIKIIGKKKMLSFNELDLIWFLLTQYS